MNKKMNNKGFSLVELIVVIAIMGILAVTLAPRLTQYVEKARVANDQENLSQLFNAAKIAKVENPIVDSTTINLGATSTETPSVFEVSLDGKSWTLETSYTAANTGNQAFIDELMDIVGNFKLESKNVVAASGVSGSEVVKSQIILKTSDKGVLSLVLDYDGDGSYTDGKDLQVVE